jgi:hypothetical protein
LTTVIAALACSTATANASLVTPTSNPGALADAMSSQAGLVTGASWPDIGTTNPSSDNAGGVGHQFSGNYMPDDGTSFAALTNGSVTLADPPNDSTAVYTSNGNSYGGANDVSILKVDVNVPNGANCLGLDAVFYSEEYPEFVGIQWNDAFIAELDGTSWQYSEEARDVTAPDNFAFDENGKLLEVNTVDFESSTGLQYDGGSKLLTAATPVSPGPHSIYLSIYDAGDENVDSAVFLDNLRTSTTNNCVAGAADADTDGDGLPQSWEEHGIDTDENGSVDVDLPAMGADPNHKDVFVELDSMPNLRLKDKAVAMVEKAFMDAPVSNPDGTTGIHLHIDNGATSVMNPVTGEQWGSRSQAGTIPFKASLGSSSGSGSKTWWKDYFDPIKGGNFSHSREPAFHYALSVDRYDGSLYSGISRGIPSSDLIVALGPSCNPEASCPGPVIGQAGTLMHELGHNLGLKHGGQVGTNNVPNYLSVMNYRFQLSGLPGSPDGLDYSRFKQDDFGVILDESALDENLGFDLQPGSILFGDKYKTIILCAQHHLLSPDTYYLKTISLIGSIDFNCNGQFDDDTVTAPLDAEVDPNAPHETTDLLAAFEDWTRLKYKGGALGGSGLGALLPEALEGDEAPIQTLQVNSDAFVTPPQPITGNADAIEQRSATLHGSVDPQGDASTRTFFQYGTDTSYGQRTSLADLNGSGVTPVAAALSGLAPETTYHYQLVAESDTHLVYGADGTFVTGGPSTQAGPGSTAAVEPPVGTGPLSRKPVKKAVRCKKGFVKKRHHGAIHCVKVKKHRRAHAR